MTKPTTSSAEPSAATSKPHLVSATEAQNNFGRVLSQVAAQEPVFITKYDRPTAVVLSIEQYRSLEQQPQETLEVLTREFDSMVERMQTAEAFEAGNELFSASPQALGEAAVWSAKRSRT